jgi:hypothetical protein
MVKKSSRRKKDLYWHKTAETCLAHNFKPAIVAKIVKAIFPQAEVNGRHIGAYKRRLITEGMVDVEEFDNRGKMTSIEMTEYCRSILSPEDTFIYTASIGSVKRSLKCFEYKLTAELENELDKVDIWLTKIKR